MSRFRRHWLGALVIGGGLLPLLWLAVDALGGRLTANPIQAATLRTGYPALVLLLLSLACTPLSTLSGWKAPLGQRRALGLLGVLYATLHLLIFVWLDYGLDQRLIVAAIVEKRFVLAGLTALLLLLPLALTSTRGWMRRLGRRWRQLHRLVYLAVPLAVLHYLWLVKADYRQPLLFAGLVALLLLLRLPALRQRLIGLRHRLAPRRDRAHPPRPV
jgi:sulfoxide reductase heme-binding subunit YedZ